MKRLLAITIGLMAMVAHAAGFHSIDIPAGHDGPALKGAVWYPSTQAPGTLTLGPYTLSVAKDAPISSDRLPLVVISHGWGGTFLGHRDVAQTLADAGFVVVAVNHGDNAMNERRNGDFSVLFERPADVRRVIDFMLGPWPDAARIDAERVGFFGFSRGGYTGLVIVGANPVFGKTHDICESSDRSTCVWPTLPHDARVKAAVIADPLSVFFTAEGLKNVKVPIQLWGSERGGDGVTPESVKSIARELTAPVEFHSIANSQHFSFLPPCPIEMTKRMPEICSDAPSFDRAAFHQEMNAQVLAFFRKNLMRAPMQ